MRHFEVSLEDKYELQQGRAFITGVQALIRVMLDQRRLDARAGLKTAGFVDRADRPGRYDGFRRHH